MVCRCLILFFGFCICNLCFCNCKTEKCVSVNQFVVIGQVCKFGKKMKLNCKVVFILLFLL